MCYINKIWWMIYKTHLPYALLLFYYTDDSYSYLPIMKSQTALLPIENIDREMCACVYVYIH